MSRQAETIQLLARLETQIQNLDETINSLRQELTLSRQRQAEDIRGNSSDIADLTAAVQEMRVHIQELRAWQMAHELYLCPFVGLSQTQTLQLSVTQLLVNHFNVEELNQLAFALSIGEDDIRGETIQQRAAHLVQYLQRRKRLSQLIEAAARQRPEVPWPTVF